MTLAEMDGRKFTWLFLATLAVGLAVAYGNSFGVGFYFDDSYGIRDNPALRSLRNIPSFFTDPYTLTAMRANVDVRPVLVTTYALNYAISGNEPWSYHAFNLIVHFLSSVIVFVLVRDYLWWPSSSRGPNGAARLPAAAAALFFALAPINNQALNYMWARSALLCTAFYLAAFLALMKRRTWLAGLLHVLALLVKAIALTLPAIFVVYAFLYRDRERQPDLRAWLRNWKELVPPIAMLAILNVLYLAHRGHMLPPGSTLNMQERWVTPWVWFVSQWPAMLHYVRIFVWPAGLSVDHDFPYTVHLTQPRAWASLLVLLAWIVAVLRTSTRQPHLAFATLWFFITLAPESSFVPLAEVVNDHRPYLASALGLSVLLAWLLERAVSLVRRGRASLFAALTLLVSLIAAVIGHRRTADWADDRRLWESTVATSPRNGRAWMNAGLAQMHGGDLKAARTSFEKARQLAPQYAFVYMNLSALELNEGHPAQAVTWAKQAVRFGPQFALSYYHLGQALFRQGKLPEAIAEFRRACDLEPDDAHARAALARAVDAQKQSSMMTEALRLRYQVHDAEAAVSELRSLLALNPVHYGATFQLARALDAAGRPEEARPVWEKMLPLAVRAKDTKTEAEARERLARSNP